MTTDTLAGGAGDNSQNLAMLGYALLFASIFFAGFPALIAVVIAYSQRGSSGALIGSHFAFQIRIFWVAFALSLAAAACGLAGVIGGLGEVVSMAEITGLDHLETIRVQFQDFTIGTKVIALIALALLLTFLSSLWLLCAPAVGFIRLASERGMGDSARP
ncbi:hypothetical protein [Phenylobacterium sp. J367]|uniref:hypothetical protein n=1 Tax=Phenylobacterium sp. J367 TaxID=2898435 RepID=UPI002151721D|nr:hypothetical protein [Phenylobacterium sp. J367]MCR5880329.1 hypothetical protein [Phenylobacterium sp. J367]